MEDEQLRSSDGHTAYNRADTCDSNGLNGEIVGGTGLSPLPVKYHPRRVRRTRLQSALVAKVPLGIIRLDKKLLSMENLEHGGVRLVFVDGTETIADLVVGGDGIRSVSLVLWLCSNV